MSKAFYRKYRSKKLSEVIGQNHITSVLDSALKNNKIAHAYLLTGPRGVGKTSVARILAHEINNLEYNEEDIHPDIIEIDAASNNSVDDIRQLREQVQVAPISAKKRIYIIDEVHMLSKQAFNALLKTLEEPPKHVVFILATTDAHKIPVTIVSRTQQFVFRYISDEDIFDHLKSISEKEKIKISDDALKIITERGGGSFRDSISLLDQIAQSRPNEEISAVFLENILGLASKKTISLLIDSYKSQDTANIIKLMDEVKKSGVNMSIFVEQFISEVKNSLQQNPQLAELILPLIEAKNSPFADIEILAHMIKPKKNKNISATTITQPNFTVSLEKPKPEKISPKPKSQPKKSITKATEEVNLNEKVTAGEAKDFSWEEFLAELKTLNMTAFSILNKAEPVMENGILKLYAQKSIYKKKIDTAKYRALVGEALANIGAGGWQIESFAEQIPPKDETTAAVFDIMGGGEEVSINE